jgi:hypothetical protein
MGRLKWILVCGALMAALSVNVAAAGPRSDANVFFDSHVTTEFAATLMSLGMAQAGGEELETAVSVSNTMASPFAMMPPGADLSGVVWMFCYNQDGTSWVYNSANDLVDGVPIGSGLEEDGTLAAGGTFTVFLSEVINAVAGEDLRFVGYCYVVGEFDAIVGSYVNYLPLVGIQQDFVMQDDFAGVPVVVAVAP